MVRKDVEQETAEEANSGANQEQDEEKAPNFLKEDIGERLDRDFQLG